MTIEQTLVTTLQGLGADVYPLVAPENASYPLIVYQRISTVPIRSHAGNFMDRPRYQISVWSNEYEEVVDVAANVKQALDLNQTDFELATREGEIDTVDPESGLYRKILEFNIWKQE